MKTLYDFGLNEQDFCCEFNVTGNEMEFIVNGVKCFTIDPSIFKDIKFDTSVSSNDLLYSLKLDSINWYLSNNQYVRKLKIKKIKEKYES